MATGIFNGFEINGWQFVLLFFILIVAYFLPTLIRSRYEFEGGTISFILINIFLGWTPIPRFILLLDVIDKKNHKMFF